MVWVNIDVDEGVHRKAKAISATRGQTLKGYLLGLIRDGVEADEYGS